MNQTFLLSMVHSLRPRRNQGITPSALSQTIRGLEEELGSRCRGRQRGLTTGPLLGTSNIGALSALVGYGIML